MWGLHGRVIGLISIVVHRGRLIVEVWTARAVLRIEMGLGAMKAAVK
jgi:hypothetical protein